jgi:hypothetical protein
VDLAGCVEEVVAGLMQPDGRAPGTPGGDAATAFLVAALEARGLAAPAFGRTQAFAMSTRRTNGEGALTWGFGHDAQTRVAGDGWEAVPGSAAGVRVGLALPRVWGMQNLALTGSDGPVWWIRSQPERDEIRALQLWIDESLAVQLQDQRFDVGLAPALVTGRNVFAWVPGAGALADEVVIVGGHRDHLPMLGNLVFPGADDNASGVAASVCALAAYAEADPAPTRRSVLGIWFDGEEDGMWGSAAWVAAPGVPLDATRAVLVLDMVGRLAWSPVVIGGMGAQGWIDAVATSADRYGIPLRADPSPSRSDDETFDGLAIPAAHLFTGLHPDYHEPSDVPARLDWAGLAAVTGWTTDLVGWLATTQHLPAWVGHADEGIRLGGVDTMGRPLVGSVVAGSQAEAMGFVAGSTVVFRGTPADRAEPCAWLGRLEYFAPGIPGISRRTVRTIGEQER